MSTVPGCVATAMAQVMKNRNQPEVEGSNGYYSGNYGRLFACFDAMGNQRATSVRSSFRNPIGIDNAVAE